MAGSRIDDADLEDRVREAWDRADYEAAVTPLVECVGPKVMAFLIHRLHNNVTDASDVFSAYNEALWRGLPRFEWRCTARGWCFLLARFAADQHCKRRARLAQRTVPLSQAPISKLEAAVREPTRPHLRTDTKTKMREQFERLSADDQALIQLRIDQRLSWRDLAVVFEFKDKVPSETELKASAAKLSQRFHRLTDRLRQTPPAAKTS